MSRNDSHNVSISEIYKRPTGYQDQWPVSTTSTIPISQRFINKQDTFRTLARKKRDQRYLLRLGGQREPQQENQPLNNEIELNSSIIIGAAYSIKERKNRNIIKKDSQNHSNSDCSYKADFRNQNINSLISKSAIPDQILESKTMLIQDMLQAQERLQASKMISKRTHRQFLNPIKNTVILSKDLSHLDIYGSSQQKQSPYQEKPIWPSSSLSPKQQNSRNGFHQQPNLKLMKQRLLPIIPNNNDQKITHQNFKLEWDSTVVNNQFVEVKLDQFSRNIKQHKNHKSLNENCGASIFPDNIMNRHKNKSKQLMNSPRNTNQSFSPLKTIDIELPLNHTNLFTTQNQEKSPTQRMIQLSIVNESTSPNIQILRKAIRDARIKQAQMKDLSRKSQLRGNSSFDLDQSILNNNHYFKQTVQDTIKEFNESNDRNDELDKKKLFHSDFSEKQGPLKFRLQNGNRNRLMKKINQLATTQESYRYENSSIQRQLEQQQKLAEVADQKDDSIIKATNKKISKRINNLRIEPWEEIQSQWKISSEGSPNP